MNNRTEKLGLVGFDYVGLEPKAQYMQRKKKLAYWAYTDHFPILELDSGSPYRQIAISEIKFT